MKVPRVSVVMPVRNGERFVTEASQSILQQSFADLELVIVDDGSSDMTPALICGMRERDSRVVMLRNEQSRGITRALNNGCAAARGTYIARMDADDISLPRRIERQVRLLDAKPEVGIVGGQMTCSNLAGSVTWPALYPANDGDIRGMLATANPFGHPAVMFRRGAFEAAGGYRDACLHAEDYDLWVRILDHCHGANLLGTVLVYRVHVDQTAFRDWRQHCLSTLAVQAAVAIRAAGGSDPLADVSVVTEATLHDLGISTSQKVERYVESLISLSNLAGRIGARGERRRLLTEARVHGSCIRLSGPTAARLALVEATAALEDRAPVRALGSWAQAIHADPQAATALVRDAIYRRRAVLRTKTKQAPPMV